MKPHPLRALWSLLFALLVLLSVRAGAVTYGTNLVVNGNAESGPSSSTGAAVAIPGWTTAGAMSVVPYGSLGGFPTASDPGPPDRANQFFAGGYDDLCGAYQYIDVSANAAAINTGNVVCDLSGWLGGYSNNDYDNATFQVVFYNGGTKISDGPTIGPVAPVDRNYATGMVYRSALAIPVPVNTTQIKVILIMTRVTGTFNDAYADSLSLVLRAPAIVTTIADSGAGSLRTAILAGSRITFDPIVFASNQSHTINLQTALPDLFGTTIIGPGSSALTVRRDTGTPPFRIFNIPAGTAASISGLRIDNGFVQGAAGTAGDGGGAQGGGIWTDGTLTLSDCVVSNCAAIAGRGADGTFGSQATYGGFGGDAAGGGIYGGENSVLVLTNCTIRSNSVSGGNGGNNNASSLNVHAYGGDGGSGLGGGLYSTSLAGNVTCSNCAFESNAVFGGKGGNETASTGGTAGGDGGFAAGGGIYGGGGTVSNCTFSGNQAFPGNGGDNPQGLDGGFAGNASGGGVYFGGIFLGTLTNCTLSTNRVYDGLSGHGISGGGTAKPESGGGIDGGNIVLNNDLISGNIASTGPDAHGTTFSGDYNLIRDPNGWSFNSGGSHNKVSQDPVLDPSGLQNNGGPTRTIAILPGSSAINAGNDANAPARDQRYYLRSGVSDIGAFEFGGTLAPLSAVSRKTHGSIADPTKTFGIDLPLTGVPLGVECRRNTGADTTGPNVGRDHEVIVTFASSLSSMTVGSASVTSSNMTDTPPPNATVSVNSNVVTVDLHHIQNVRRLTINLTNVSDGAHTNNVNVPMGVLLGDASGDGKVLNGDVGLVKAQVSNPVSQANCRDDVTIDGRLLNGDVSVTKAHVSTFLPP